MQSTESLLNIAFNSSLQTYGGDIAVGSMTILSSLMQVLNLMLMGMTQGAQPIISYNFGAKNNTRIKKTFRLLLICSLCYSFLFWALVMLFPYASASIFSGDVTLLKATAWSMRIYFAVAFLLAIQTACQQTFIAVGQVKCSLFLALLRKIVLLIPLIYILPCFFADKVFAVFLAEPISDVLSIATTAVLFACQFKKILAKNIALQEDKQAHDINTCDAAV